MKKVRRQRYTLVLGQPVLFPEEPIPTVAAEALPEVLAALADMLLEGARPNDEGGEHDFEDHG